MEQSNKQIQIIFIDCSPVADWLDSLIRPSGLLLVVSHVYAVPVSVLWVGLEKKLVIKNLDVRNNLAGSHTEHPRLLFHVQEPKCCC
jgi:hypothetical protein